MRGANGSLPDPRPSNGHEPRVDSPWLVPNRPRREAVGSLERKAAGLPAPVACGDKRFKATGAAARISGQLPSRAQPDLEPTHPTWKSASLRRAATTVLERRTGQIIPWVFHRKGQPIKSYDVAWRTACNRAGYPGRFVHDFRRTAVRNLERAGVSRSVAMQLTGHKTESVYRRYAIVVEADLWEGVEKLARLGVLNPRSSTILAQSGGLGR